MSIFKKPMQLIFYSDLHVVFFDENTFLWQNPPKSTRKLFPISQSGVHLFREPANILNIRQFLHVPSYIDFKSLGMFVSLTRL